MVMVILVAPAVTAVFGYAVKPIGKLVNHDATLTLVPIPLNLAPPPKVMTTSAVIDEPESPETVTSPTVAVPACTEGPSPSATAKPKRYFKSPFIITSPSKKYI
jgi:hypothetical protein